jgi:hypothetical protein
MTRAGFLAASLAALIILTGPMGATDVAAADRAIEVRPGHTPASVLPFPRDERADAVWASGGCWTACTSHTTWALAACLSAVPQGECVARADADGRACQRACRLRGGPYLAIE